MSKKDEKMNEAIEDAKTGMENDNKAEDELKHADDKADDLKDDELPAALSDKDIQAALEDAAEIESPNSNHISEVSWLKLVAVVQHKDTFGLMDAGKLVFKWEENISKVNTKDDNHRKKYQVYARRVKARAETEPHFKLDLETKPYKIIYVK